MTILNSTSHRFLLLMLILIFSIGSQTKAQEITAQPVPDQLQPSAGDTIHVAISVNIAPTATPDSLLGSYTCDFSWDPDILSYLDDSGLLSNFVGVVNRDSISQGKLRFPGVNVAGKNGSFNLMNITFMVIGSEGSQSGLYLNFSAMAAANTFKNLLPFLTLQDTTVHVKMTTNIMESQGIIRDFYLEQNYPNPFNPNTMIRFWLPATEFVRLEVYDMLGAKVARLVDNKLPAGFHSVAFNGKSLPSGFYIYSLHTPNISAAKQMLLIK